VFGAGKDERNSEALEVRMEAAIEHGAEELEAAGLICRSDAEGDGILEVLLRDVLIDEHGIEADGDAAGKPEFVELPLTASHRPDRSRGQLKDDELPGFGEPGEQRANVKMTANDDGFGDGGGDFEAGEIAAIEKDGDTRFAGVAKGGVAGEGKQRGNVLGTLMVRETLGEQLGEDGIDGVAQTTRVGCGGRARDRTWQ